ncbi:MAG TPA: AAA family ATPase [Nitrospirota bacterium]|nr:AAA family ATPase [Nitrospirota bacterium]
MHTAKFLPPRAAPVLDRDRLLNRLHAWDDKKLVIIHGQAGQGKSTLAAGFARATESPFLWYNMDQEDENPALFLSSLGQALQLVFPGLVPALPRISHDRHGVEALRHTARQWVRQVFASLAAPCLIIFDDLNNTSCSPELLQVLATLFEDAPSHVRFMVLSRTRPELAIAGLRARRAVAEMSGSDLKFSDGEAQDLFSSVFGMHLAPDDAALVNRTAEGWPTALVLMHEYLATASAPLHESLKGPGRNALHAHVFDYLAQEVIAHLPADLQQFLLRTFVSDHLPAPLMTQLTGLPQGKTASLLAELRRRNLFIAAADDAGTVIRYHALFREFLSKKLWTSLKPCEARKLYSRASVYFARSGDAVRAVDLLLASGQFAQALRLIETSAPGLISRGKTQTLLRWQGDLPKDNRNRPWFHLARAVSCRFTDPRAALSFFDLAQKGFRSRTIVPSRGSGLMLSLCGIIEQCFHTGGDFSRMERTARQALTILSRGAREPQVARARLHLALGMAWFFTGKLQKSADSLTRALDLFGKQGDVFYQITCAVYLTPCALYEGDFPLAREALRRGFEAHAAIPHEMGSRAALLLTSAMTALFEGDFTEAQERIDECRRVADSHTLESIGFLSLDIEGWLKIAQGDYRAAEVLLGECKRRGSQSGNEFFRASASHLLAITYLFQGKLRQAKCESDSALAVRS